MLEAIYKCRNCGLPYTKIGFPDETTIGEPLSYIGMIDYHHCYDSQRGIADLQGANIIKMETEPFQCKSAST